MTIHVLSPNCLWQLDRLTLARWAEPFATKPTQGAEEPLRNQILVELSRAIPNEMGVALATAIGKSLVPGGWFEEARFRIGAALPKFRDLLLEEVGYRTYAPRETGLLLDAFINARVQEAVGVATRMLRSWHRSPTAREYALVAGSVLLVRAPASAWPELNRVLMNDEQQARELFENAAADRDSMSQTALDGLSDEQVADLHLRIAYLYPPSGDTWHTGVYSPGSRDNLSDWRSQLIRVLEARRRESSVAQLERIARARPDAEWLARTWVEARAALRGERWRGTEPRELMRVAERAELRLVESGSDLLDVLKESLERLQQDLQGELRAVVGLWNESEQGNVPKREEHLANAIARHFRQDLRDRQLVIGRELILQVGILGGASGQRTDIDVVANSRPGSNRMTEQIRVTIEVKGSWNPSVPTAMKDQLVLQYLDPHSIPNGLYVVGQFACSSWRRGSALARSLKLGTVEALVTTLSNQAMSLTTAMRNVRAFVLDASLPDGKKGRKTSARGRTRSPRVGGKGPQSALAETARLDGRSDVPSYSKSPLAP